MILRFGKLLPWMLLLAMGFGWGLAFSLAKMGILAGGMPFGMAFWQMFIAVILTFVIARLRGRPVPMDRHHIRNYLILSVLGSSIPSCCLLFAAGRVPAGVISITLAIVPMLTYAIALGLGRERRSLFRLTGLFCCIGAILLLVLPESSFPDRSAVLWILVAAIAPICHALNSINLSRQVIMDIHPLHVIFGANLFGAMTLLPIAFASGHFFVPSLPFGTLEWTILGNGMINVLAFLSYISVIQLAGPVFASQTGYLVTIAGVAWGIALFGESHSGWVWMSLTLMIIGLSLVSPRRTTSVS